MSFVSGTTGNEAAQKFLEVLQNDFRTLSNETRKKYPQIKEVSYFALVLYVNHFKIIFLFQSCEEAIMKLKAAASAPSTPVYYVVNQILYPLVQGCESKDLKIIKVCIQFITPNDNPIH